MKKTGASKSWFLGIFGQASIITTAAIALNLSSPTPVGATEPDVTLRIWVANYAQVPKRELSRAERIAGSIFHDARVDMIWFDSPLGGMHRDSKYEVRPGNIFLTVLRQAAPGTFSPHELGFAIPCAEPKIGCQAYISYPLVRDLARNGDVSKSEILGAAMAHEMGHILLGAGHSCMGIMKPHWNQHDLSGVAWHQLNFMPHEAKQLHAVVQLLRNGIAGANGKR